MNKIKIFACLGLASGLAFAQGNLWRGDTDFAPSLQVQTPGAVYCWAQPGNEPTEENGYDSPCYAQTGGWWFGYGYGPNEGTPYDAATNLNLKNSGAMQLADDMGDPQGGAGFSVSANAIVVKFSTLAGTDEDPSGAGIGFNWRNKDGNDYQNQPTQDISGQSGLCVTYQLSGQTTGTGGSVWVELGWNEKVHGFNTWVHELPAASSWTVRPMAWSTFEKSWTQAGSPEQGIALSEAEALKFKLSNKGATPREVQLSICQIGWLGTCTSTCGTVPVAGPGIGLNPAKFNLDGRMLSLANSEKSVSVQVINMQGAVVTQKLMSSNSKVNLSNMPVGIYIVRSADLGISQRIILK